jgi:hypothetical protein
MMFPKGTCAQDDEIVDTFLVSFVDLPGSLAPAATI